MTNVYVGSVVIDVNDLDLMKEFWEQALGYEASAYEPNDWAKLEPPDGGAVNVSLQQVPEKKTEKNRLHLDLYSATPKQEVERLVGLGAIVVKEQNEDEDFTVLADPEGNLFCVIDKSEEFLTRQSVV